MMTNKDAFEILEKHFTGRKDRPDYPDIDDIHNALYTIEGAIKQLAEKDKEIEELLEKQSLLNRDNIIIVKQLDDPTCYVSLEEYEQQLSKKDKEIEMLDLMIKTLPEHDKEMKQLICEKIRDAISQEKLNIGYADDPTKRIINEIICKQFVEDKKSFIALIDRIEKGE